MTLCAGICDRILVRHKNEAPADFAKRKTCGKSECRAHLTSVKQTAFQAREHDWTRELRPWPTGVWYG